jgi:hypothetical protein
MWQEYYPQPDAVEKMARTAKRTTAKPDEKQKIFDDARQHRALQFQTMPETLDILFSTTQAGPNMAYIENYWSNLRSVVKSRQDEVVSNAKLESKMPLAIVQVFHLIASEDIYSPSRTKLAGIASTMSEGVEGLEEIITGTDDPVAKAGFAWWVWRYAPDDIVFVKRPEHFYEQAILGDESVPGLYYELAHYYIVGRGNARRAFEAAKKAQGLAKDDDLQNLARVTTIAAGTILEASDERHLSNTEARTELEKLNGSVSDSKYRDHMSALAEVLRNKGATEIAEMLENQNGADS